MRSGIVSLVFSLLLASMACADPIADARDLTARAKMVELDAGSALSQGDRAGWESKTDESRRMFRSAAQLYRDAGADTSDTTSLVAEYAATLELSRDFDLAADAYARCAELAPDVAEWHLKCGLALVQVGASYHPAAKASLDRVLALAPDTLEAARASSALASLYLEAGHPDLAERHAQAASVHLPDDVANTGTLAAALIRRGAMAEADAALGRLQSFRGDELIKLQTLVAVALAAFDRNRSWFDDTAANHAAYGRLLSRTGRFADAAPALKRAEQLAPQDTAVINLLAAALLRAGDPQGARAAYERSLAINPDQAAAQRALDAVQSN